MIRAKLVVRWVTTCEALVLNVFFLFLFLLALFSFFPVFFRSLYAYPSAARVICARDAIARFLVVLGPLTRSHSLPRMPRAACIAASGTRQPPTAAGRVPPCVLAWPPCGARVRCSAGPRSGSPSHRSWVASCLPLRCAHSLLRGASLGIAQPATAPVR